MRSGIRGAGAGYGGAAAPRLPARGKLEEEIAWQAVRGGSTAGPDIEAGLRAAVKAMVTDPGGGRDVARWAAQAWRRLPGTVAQTEAARLLAVGFALRLGTSSTGVTSLGQQAMPRRWAG